MNELTTLYVECEQWDAYIAGTVGDAECLEGWQDRCRLLITTDDPTALMERLDTDANVLSYEVCQDDEAEAHRNS